MLLKVHDGTPKHSSSLCLTCRNATYVRGHTKTLIDCSALSIITKDLLSIQPVLTCSEYDDKRRPSLSSMKDIAWNLEPNKKSGQLGFKPPEKGVKALFNPLSGKDEW
jgi:hypothetical protein